MQASGGRPCVTISIRPKYFSYEVSLASSHHTSTHKTFDMDELTDQLHSFQLSERYIKSSDIPRNSKMRSNGYMLFLESPRSRKVSLCCKKTFRNNASGLIYSPDDDSFPVRTATSGYVETKAFEQQLANDDGECVRQMCSDLDYYLARTSGLDHSFDGQYLAVHVEKRLLEWYDRFQQKGLFLNITVVIPVGRRPCLDCLIFAAVFEVKTQCTVEIVFDRDNQMERYRPFLDLATEVLTEIKEVHEGLKHGFAIVEEVCTNGQHKREHHRRYANTDETYDEWLDGFIEMRKEREEGRTHQRTRKLHVEFVDEY